MLRNQQIEARLFARRNLRMAELQPQPIVEAPRRRRITAHRAIAVAVVAVAVRRAIAVVVAVARHIAEAHRVALRIVAEARTAAVAARTAAVIRVADSFN